MIVNLSMTGHNRTIVDTYNALSQTSTKFQRLVSRYIKRLPKISANRDMCHCLHNMRQILKQYGRGSGLVMALKETINSPQWINAWINLLFTGVATWMYVTAIFWKKGKNRFSYLPCTVRDVERNQYVMEMQVSSSSPILLSLLIVQAMVWYGIWTF